MVMEPSFPDWKVTPLMVFRYLKCSSELRNERRAFRSVELTERLKLTDPKPLWVFGFSPANEKE